MFALAAALLVLGCRCSEHVFVQETSLLSPYVDEIGRFANWKVFGEQVVKVHGRDTFVQLGYSSPGSSGAIVASHPVGSETFSIDVGIEIGDVGKGDGNDGMAIWMSGEQAFSEGACFGRSCSFRGLLVVIKPSGKPYIGVKAGDVSVGMQGIGKSLDRVEHRDFVPGEQLVVRIEQKSRELSVYAGPPDGLSLVHSYKLSVVGKDGVLGVSASTDRSSTTFKLVGIESYHLKEPSGGYAREDAHSGGRLIWLLLVCVVCVTGYYLYTIQIKKE